MTEAENLARKARVRELVAALYADSSVGCCMHVQIDDGNLEGRFFGDDSRAYVTACGKPQHLELFDLLASLSGTQRRSYLRAASK